MGKGLSYATKGNRVGISALAIEIPQGTLTNLDLEKMVDTSDEWIKQRTGIEVRHIAEPGTPVSMLAVASAKKALDASGLDPKDIDMIIAATATVDMPVPPLACIIQRELGAESCMAFDVLAACSGFIYSCSLAERYIATGAADRILVVCAEILSKLVDYTDRSTCVLFGDASAAVVLEKVPDDGFLSFAIGAEGKGADLIRVTLRDDMPKWRIQMQGQEVYRAAPGLMVNASLEAIELANISLSDISLVVPHQANERITDAYAKRLGIPREKVYSNIARYGNTSAASIPVALFEAVKEERLHDKDVVLMAAVGGGLTWAASTLVWNGVKLG